MYYLRPIKSVDLQGSHINARVDARVVNVRRSSLCESEDILVLLFIVHYLVYYQSSFRKHQTYRSKICTKHQ